MRFEETCQICAENKKVLQPRSLKCKQCNEEGYDSCVYTEHMTEATPLDILHKLKHYIDYDLLNGVGNDVNDNYEVVRICGILFKELNSKLSADRSHASIWNHTKLTACHMQQY